MHILETSNVGNSYGAYYDTKERGRIPCEFAEDDPRKVLAGCWNAKNYIKKGDPYGLQPVMPSLSRLPDNAPYLDSNTITAFSVLDTGTGMVDSYYFDTQKPESKVVHFDSFSVL